MKKFEKSHIYMAIGSVLFIAILCKVNFISINNNINEKQDKLVQDFINDHNNYVIKDYTYGEDKSLIKVALTYYDKDTDTNSNVAIIGEKGIGFIDLVGGNKDYIFVFNEPIKIKENNTVSIALYNRNTNKIVDYSVIVSEDNLGTNYVLESKVRD
jgi:hypothetical protein